MRERDIELYLITQVKKHGGICWKFTSPSVRGVPDRIVLLGGEIWFIEVKAPGKKPTAMQTRRMDQLAAQGANVGVLDTKNAIDEFIDRRIGDE